MARPARTRLPDTIVTRDCSKQLHDCVMKPLFHAILHCLAAAPAFAGKADVVAVQYERTADGSYNFHVTVRHADSGWDHYADKWQVMGADGAVLGERMLVHPHETEQPFTRSLSGVEIPDGLRQVTVRAHDKIHGFGGVEMKVQIKDGP